ncbi:MAG: hypothetical protein ACJASL_002438 [Paraglaciecola sp.]|jgi:hypothetical protein
MGLKQIGQSIINRLPLGYYNGRLYKIVMSAPEQSKFELATDEFKPWILIVSRDYYQESLDKLAITNQKEVTALLKLNNVDEQSNNAYCVNTITDNHTFFNRWTFTKNLASALFTIPEGLLVVKGVAENKAMVVEDAQHKPRLYVASSPQGLYSAKPTAVLNSLSRFCQSAGLPQQLNSAVLGAAQLPAALLKGLRSMSAKQWMALWRTPHNSLSYNNIKAPLITGLSCASVYLALSSGYVYWQNAQLEQQLQAGKAEVTEALAVQDEFTALQLQIESLSAVIGGFKSKTIMWEILLPLYTEAKFDNVRYQDGRFIVRGNTAKATELLAKLANHEGVLDAHFDLPVITNRGQEKFTISFRWQAPKQSIAKEKDDAVAA